MLQTQTYTVKIFKCKANSWQVALLKSVNEARQNHIICIFPLLLLLNCLFVHMTVNRAKCAPALRDGRPSLAIIDSSYPTAPLPRLLKKQGVTWRWKWPTCSLNGTAALETMTSSLGENGREAAPSSGQASEWLLSGENKLKNRLDLAVSTVFTCVSGLHVQKDMSGILGTVCLLLRPFGHVYNKCLPFFPSTADGKSQFKLSAGQISLQSHNTLGVT